MSLSRRDFMKVFGASLASLLLAHCRRAGDLNPTPSPTLTEGVPTITCYAPMPPETLTPTLDSFSARQRLRLLWLRFDELFQVAISDSEQGTALQQQLISDHRLVLDELVAAAALTAPVADLVQEAYTAALFHTWRSNAPMTCYVSIAPYYESKSAAALIQQTLVLTRLSADIDPQTLATVKAVLERDLAVYALTDEEVQAMYNPHMENGKPYPEFADVELELTLDAQTAVQFILDLLMGK